MDKRGATMMTLAQASALLSEQHGSSAGLRKKKENTSSEQGNDSGFGAAESASQQLTVLREAAGLDMMFYRMQVETKVDGA